ncbi:hypothetical protein [Rivibacter subsaxonicus]|uniref:Uncharacterized protein n=1 Tax=Rivibacter subsaxonicus TaxID=457575 RepID=A0A4Q7W021_9BURK|nr:hypothetical protein [Rivibacter subsaxonicus]RZU02487.1 hypothetical protein EV670_0511 [Rivibacter subsaxonicus]
MASVLLSLATMVCADTAPPALSAAPAPTWAVDPALAGDELPPVGRSLFDHLLAEPGERRLPTSFDELRRRIEAHVVRDPAAAVPGLKQVLIPLGRSLQRLAGGAEPFASPRIVLAVDEPAATRPGRAGLLLKDRLYLGFQPRADLLEVISYNEAAGRFEFQVVRDFRPGGSPHVVYARRALCLSCHQNGGPIFSRPGWDETNANPAVAARLLAHGPAFEGVAVARGVDMPNAIDDATDRANLLVAAQRLWRDGCGGDDDAALACRAALFSAVLQQALSGGRAFDRDARGWREQVLPTFAARGRAQWPGGLAIGNPDLPNRAPLAAEGVEPSARLDVAAAYDPLLARPPIEVWRSDDDSLAQRAVIGLVPFIAAPDLARLDARLAARRDGATRRSLRADCRFARTPAAASDAPQRIDFSCEPSAGAAGGGLAPNGHVDVRGSRVVGGRVASLRQGGAGGELRALELGAGPLQRAGQRYRARLPLRAGALSARAADGNAIEAIELAWGGAEGNASAILVEDFAPVAAAIDSMLRSAREGRFDGFDAQAFRRARLLPALEEGLRMPRLDWCCLDARGLPAAAVDAPPTEPSSPPATVAAARAHESFYRHCAGCHLTVDRFPPAFLRGDAARVDANLAQCAERLHVRLSMWQSPPGQRAKTPMPPATALRAAGSNELAWRDGTELASMRKHVAELLRQQTGRAPDVAALLAGGYERLRPCLDEAAGAAAPTRH